MLAIVAAVAVGFTSPAAVNADFWFGGFGDHPREGALTVVASETIVDPKGKTADCSARAILGIADWAPFTCQLILKRGSFRAAKIGDQKTYGVFRLRIVWVQSGYGPDDLPVWDFQVALNKPPAGVRLPLLKKIQFIVDPAGQITNCAADGHWNAELVALACGQLPKMQFVHPVGNSAGQAVTSVQDAAVRFVAEKTN
jgi:hypothetical protein